MGKPSGKFAGSLPTQLGSRLTAGRQVLALVIGVRIPAPQQIHAPVAQLDRASGYGPEGWGFESSRVYTARSSSGQDAALSRR